MGSRTGHRPHALPARSPAAATLQTLVPFALAGALVAPACGDGGNASREGAGSAASHADAGHGGGVQASAGQLAFEDVASSSKLPPGSRGCLVVRDLNGDGLDDLVVSMLDAQQLFAGIGVFRNAGGGRFEQVATFPTSLGGRACALLHADGDDQLDLVLSAGGQGSPLLLLRGDAARPGFFAEQAPIPLPSPAGAVVRTLGVADVDNDGAADLYLGLSPASDGPSPPITCVAKETTITCSTAADVQHQHAWLHNDGGGAFSQVGALSIARPGLIMGTAFHDFDDDGLVDVLEVVDFGVNRVLANRKKGAFEDVTSALGIDVPNNGMGAAIGTIGDALAIHVSEIGADQLWMREGTSGPFTNRSTELGLAQTSSSHSAWAAIMADFDNDGALDVVEDEAAAFDSLADFSSWAAAFPYDQRRRSLCVLALGSVADPARRTVGRHACRDLWIEWGDSATASGDLDGDGLLDVVVGGPQRMSILMNRSAKTGNWLGARLTAKATSRNTVGAKVTFFDGATAVCTTTVGTEGSRGISSGVIHCGLGQRTGVSHLQVRWPGRAVQTVSGPFPHGQVVLVAEE